MTTPAGVGADMPEPDGRLSIAETVEVKSAARTRKAELLAEAARQFCDIERPSHAEITVFKEFFYQLIDGCDKAERRKLAVTIAGNAYVPRQVIFYLALDEKEIAAPILLFSKVLNERDIVNLSERLAFDRLPILCRRDDLTHAGVAALIAHGGSAAASVLAKNARAAQLPVAGLVERRLQHVAEAPADAPVSVDRPQADPLHGERPVAAPSVHPVREELLGLAARGGRLGQSPATDQGSPVTRQSGRPDQPAAPAPASSAGGQTSALADGLIAAARMGDGIRTAAMISGVAGCSVETIASLLEERSVESLCVLLKGIGIDRLAASQLLLLLRPETGRSTDELAEAIRIYRRLDAGECRQFIAMLGGIAPAGEADVEPEMDASAVVPIQGENAFARAIAERRREVSAPVLARPAPRPAAPRHAGRPFGKSGLAGRY